MATFPSTPIASDQLDGLSAQELGRGLVPRLSMGTRQLSIRCSSVHFRPSLSLPVNTGREASAEMSLAELRVASSAVAQDNAATRTNALTAS
jgi:hypothetical protein